MKHKETGKTILIPILKFVMINDFNQYKIYFNEYILN